MLEKIGLPPKPSMRGGNWVVDASHCQGCSSQFSFIHRKHHCRRCGGLFCNNCTSQRMVLRGQGDSPVRICDPCKKLEDAARFEMRHGHKSRSVKGTSKQMHKPDEEIIQELLETESKQESLTGLSTASSSSSLKEEVDVDSEDCSPEKLRQQAAEEKSKYKVLKAQGMSNEALQAFKRSKQLERQAGALEVALRKKSRVASKISHSSSVNKDEIEELSVDKKKLTPQKGKEEKKDIMAELKELGWSDADIIATEKKQANLSIEGELSSLIKEIPKSDSSDIKKESSMDRSQVDALKRNALKLKREGKLSEAKEELKKAKILEKHIEEQELLGEDEESDDELSLLIKSMNDDKNDDPLLNNIEIPNINLDYVLKVGDDIKLDDNFDITDNDLNDPELTAALKSFGWNEEDDKESAPLDREALQHEVATLKREALSQKRGGNISEAMSLLKKAKLLEKDPGSLRPEADTIEEESISNMPVKSKLDLQRELLALKKKALALRREGKIEEADAELEKGKVIEQQLEEISNMPKKSVSKLPTKIPDIPMSLDLDKDEVEEAEVTYQDMHDPDIMSVLKNLGWNENENGNDDDESESANMPNDSKAEENSLKRPKRNKADIQRDLLVLKRKALNLRRQGKTEEADEELEKAKILEEQLADIEASSNLTTSPVDSHNEVSIDDSSPEQSKKEKVLEHKRKALALKREGKLSEAREELRQAKLLESSVESEAVASATVHETKSDEQNEKKPVSSRDRFKMQQQSLAHKRNALKLRREGKIEESEREFELAKALESQLEEFSSQESKSEESKDVVVGNLLDPQLMSALKSIGWQESDMNAQPSVKVDMKDVNAQPSVKVDMKDVNAQPSAKVDMKYVNAQPSAKVDMKDMNAQPSMKVDVKVEAKVNVDEGERSRLEDMIKAEKVKALNLKRQGKQAEALEALRSAKRMEKKLRQG